MTTTPLSSTTTSISIMSGEVKNFYNFILDVVKEAGQIVVDGFYGPKNVTTKGHAFDLVTDTDKKAEELFTTRIRQRYPDHVIIGEESCSSRKIPTLTDSPTWIIDPIDGTTNFVHQVPLIGISVALAIKQETVLGIVYNPITNHLFSAIKGEGAYWDGRKIQSSKNEDFNKAIIGNEISCACIPFIKERTLLRLRRVAEQEALALRSLGTVALSLCFVASGSFDAYFTDGVRCWDVAAGLLILKEAGGCVCSPDGKSYDMNSRILLAAGNSNFLQKMQVILKECDEKTNEETKRLMPLSFKE